MLLQLTYLGVTNALAMLRLLVMSDREKDVEILVVRHQITVLHRQLSQQKVRFAPADRAFLAALLHRLPPEVLRKLRLLASGHDRTSAGTSATHPAPQPRTRSGPPDRAVAALSLRPSPASGSGSAG